MTALTVGMMLATGCSDGGKTLGANSGNLQLVMTSASAVARTADGGHSDSDEAIRRLAGAEITLSSVLARNLNGELIDITLDLPVGVDLLALMEGGTFTLPMGALPPGMYDQVVVVMNKLSLTLTDGTLVDITPPGGGWTSIVRVDPFEVADGAMTTVTLRFRPWMSFFMDGDKIGFRPEFDGHHDDDHDDHDDR
jgi:hypothetical protein